MKKNKILLPLLLCLFFVNILFADSPTAITTFNSIGVYWSPSGGISSKNVLVQYRIEGNSTWHDALPMKYQPISDTDNELADYRGSIVSLKSNTAYEIKLTLEGTSTSATLTAKTWNENFPVGKSITISDKNTPIKISFSGTADAYWLIDGTGSTIDVNHSELSCIKVTGSYLIIRGFTLKGARQHGIILEDNHDVIIENCDISDWGEQEENGFAKDMQCGIYSTTNGTDEVSPLKRIVVQRCKIHDPTWDANSWAEDYNGTKHPHGAQAIGFYQSSGNHVIRYNEIWSDEEHMFSDIIGYGKGPSYYGFPGADSDIYGNYIAYCWDDAIEAEGSNRNVRIWGNYIENYYMAIANAPTTIGPLYVWGNTIGRSYSPPGSEYGQYASLIKMGYSGDESWMKGWNYLFNNTILQPNGEGAGGIGTKEDSDRWNRYVVTRNNILNVNANNCNSISTDSKSEYYDYDYDLCSSGYPTGQEEHSIDGTPTYINDADFDYNSMTANFSLANESKGYDAGVVIPNFMDQYSGSAPDIGAFEAGQVREYGVNAYLENGTYIENEDKTVVPTDFAFGSSPNPFNPTTTIRFTIPESGKVTVVIYDIIGRAVSKLVEEHYESGSYTCRWETKERNGSPLSSGLYIARIQAGRYAKSIKLVLLK